MTPLKIETEYKRNGSEIKKISGFTPFELDLLNRMPYQDMKVRLLGMLDDRNGGIGTMWQKEVGIFQMWIGADAMFVEIGSVDT